MQHQTRSFQLEVKMTGPRKFEGYGSVFGNLDLGGDIVVRGAFRETLAKHKSEGTMPLMFWMHDPAQVPGAWNEIAEDDAGLFVAGELADTGLGRDVRTLLEMKAVRGLSIGYWPAKTAWGRDGERLLQEVDLQEVSVVSRAMNPLARVESMKARLSRDGEYVPSERELERMFRDAGCSKSVSRIMIARLSGDSGGGERLSPRWDAGGVDDDETKGALDVLERLARLTDKVGAEALRRI